MTGTTLQTVDRRVYFAHTRGRHIATTKTTTTEKDHLCAVVFFFSFNSGKWGKKNLIYLLHPNLITTRTHDVWLISKINNNKYNETDLR